MTPPIIVRRFADLPEIPWANGQGVTVELGRRDPIDHEPIGTQFFHWRLSIATIASSAWFSAFPGLDRALMALADSGLDIEVDGVRTPLGRFGVVRFRGEQRVRALDVTAPGHDLNIMVRRGGAYGEPDITAVHVTEGTPVHVEPGALAVVGLGGAVELTPVPDPAAPDQTTSFRAVLHRGDPALPGDSLDHLPAVTLTGSGAVAVVRA